MTKVARQRYATQSQQGYFALGNDCNQFARQVLDAGDPAAAALMMAIPIWDYITLLRTRTGLSRMGDPPKSPNHVKPN